MSEGAYSPVPSSVNTLKITWLLCYFVFVCKYDGKINLDMKEYPEIVKSVNMHSPFHVVLA